MDESHTAQVRPPELRQWIHVSIATWGLIIQLHSIYLFAGVHKLYDPSWRDGMGLYYALELAPVARHSKGREAKLGASPRDDILIILLEARVLPGSVRTISSGRSA